jgi:hypothetical protein
VSASATVDQIAGWDLPELRSGVGRLGGAADRLLPWRTRLDALGRRLSSAECWSGPAGTAAAAALVELSTGVSGVSGALDDSLASLRGLAAAATEAQEWAVAAQGAGVALDAAGLPVGLPPPPVPAMAADQLADVLAAREAGQLAAARAEEALSAAGRALHLAREAQHPLAGLGLSGASPVSFTDLLVQLPVVRVPAPPPPGDPRAVAGWWAGLTASEQLAVIRATPVAVGALDGLPAWARDEANRAQLATALRDLPEGTQQRAMAETVAAQLAVQAAAGQTAQLLQFDPAGDLTAVALGDLDSAAAVGVLVPGINTTPDDDLPGLLRDAAAVRAAAEDAAPGLAVAAVAWLGYRTPGLRTMASPQAARRGGPALDRVLDGLAAARSVPGGGPAPRTSLIAHSYGSVVAGQAVRAPGRLAADALVLLGSPGVPGRGAEHLEADEVYGAWSWSDPVSWLQWFGDAPPDWSFGDEPLPTEPTEGHTDYYDPDRPTLAAIGQVVAGAGEVG